MNHSRCCANDNGNACSRAARSSAGIFRPPLFSLLTSSISFPTRSRFNTCAHTPATNSSVAVLAPPSPLPPSPSLPSPLSSLPFSPLFGIPFRSTFPFTVSGIRSIHTLSPGTMYSGNLLCTYLLNSSFVVLSPPPPRFPSPPPPSSCFPSPPSLPLPSPSSPSLLTTSSPSPSSPPPSFFAVPMRHKPLRRLPCLVHIPSRQPRPSDIQLSPHSLRHQLPFLIQYVHLHVRDRPPNRHRSSPRTLALHFVYATTHHRLRRP